MNVTIKELDCYRNLSEEKKTEYINLSNYSFNLDLFPNDTMKIELKEYLYYRGRVLTLRSLLSERYLFHRLGSFISDCYPSLASFIGADIVSMDKIFKKWLVKNGKSLFKETLDIDRKKVIRSDSLLYLQRVFDYFNPVDHSFIMDNDIWNLDEINFEIRKSPIKRVRTLSFAEIPQKNIRQELKEIMLLHLKQNAVSTVNAQLSATRFFTKWLAQDNPDISSLTELSREIIEDYLMYLNTEDERKKSYRTEISHLRSIFSTASCIHEKYELADLFLISDMEKTTRTVYRSYSNEELKRLNHSLVFRHEQVARALFLHQMLGTRISETLSLTQDCIYVSAKGNSMIRIHQEKKNKVYSKPISAEITQLIQKSIEYTTSKYGKRKYIFVDDSNPDLAMPYGKIQYQIRRMIHDDDLRDDNGNLFGVGTHLWRHTYSKKLTELHVDDITIARLLGHANTSSLKHYRRMGNNIIRDETRKARTTMDEIIIDITKEWDWK
ncbi:MAG: site-specific integrase [Eubacteriales bacterium]|nr:site-specific integrase [Eubacteriales bacterium]